MATRKRKASEENPKKTNTEFLWTDDEIQLLLQTSFNFKSKCEFEELSWESVRSKYEQIFKNMYQLPTTSKIKKHKNWL